MLQDVIVPDVSEGVTSGTVISIAVAVGDQVEEDQTLLELETDKAVVAIPAPIAGTIAEVKVSEGDEAAVGSVILVLDGAEVKDSAEPVAPPQEVKAEAAVPERGAEKPLQQVESPPVAASPVEKVVELDLSVVQRGGRVAPAAPSVRRFARELGVVIGQVQGSGPGGRISRDDVRAHVKAVMQAPATSAGIGAGIPSKPLPDFTRWGTIEREPLSKVRELTAEAMTGSWTTIPMVTQYDKASVAKLEEFRRSFNRTAKDAEKLTMTAILLKVCAAALEHFPTFNSSFDVAAKELILKQYIHIGVAVDTPNGLLVPVVRDVDQKGISTLAGELNDVATRTRERKVSPAELEGGTFTISNLGGIGGTSFTPLVYAPQVAILGVSRSEEQPVWNGRDFVPELMLPLSLTYDHRVIDGADGARFLRWICDTLENPIKLVMED